MIKLRAQGTKNDLKWIRKQIERIDVFEIISCSEIYRNVGSDRYYHMYIDIRRTPGKKSKMARGSIKEPKKSVRRRTVIHWKPEKRQDVPKAA